MVEDTRLLDDEEAGASGKTFVPLDVITGTDGDDDLEGTPDDDQISGGDGNDTINGRGGDDEISGDAGDDDLLGAGGKDTLRGGPGNDTMRGGVSADLLIGQGGADTMNGNAGNDTLRGGGGNDDLRGARGTDVLNGGGGNDTLGGGGGDDTMNGGAGDDLIDGKKGFNVATGGDGLDTFAFTTLDGQMQITDFDPDNEVLDISKVINFSPGAGLVNFVDFRVIDAGTEVLVSPDGDGNFQLIAGLLDVSIDSLPREQLGIEPRNGGGGGGGGGGGAPDLTEPTVVSTNLAGTVGNGLAFLPSLSTDAQFITFSSSSTNLVNNDDNGSIFDVFIKDLSTGEVTRVSERNFPGAGIGGGDADSFGSAVSTDGSLVAFDSEADNLGGTVSGTRDVFTTEPGSAGVDLVSIPGNQFAVNPSLSADGSRVTFQATATGQAGTPDAGGPSIPRIYVRESNGDLIDVSTAAGGPADFADEASFDPDISADGNFVVFESDATNLVDTDALGFRDIFIKEIDTGTIELVSLTADDAQGFGGSSDASVSGDGSVVAFESRASFEAADINEERDIYVKDLDSGDLTLVSIGEGGIAADGPSFSPSLSDDGTRVAFISEASNLVDGDDNGIADIFVADLVSGDIQRFELDTDTSGANRELVEPELSGDGNFVAYVTGVEVGGDGGLTDAQVTVAPVDFGAGPAAVAALDTLITQPDVV